LNQTTQYKKWLTLLASICLGYELVVTAWLNDDSIFTIRTILNWLDGYGPVFNLGERVQAYTHPLWFLVLSLFLAISNSIYLTVFLASLALSFATVAIVIGRISASLLSGVFATLALLCSKAFIDYSTSGLENPLSHLLLTLACYFAFAFNQCPQKKLLAWFSLSVAGVFLTRNDLILCLIPVIFYVFLKAKSLKLSYWPAIAMGCIPITAWLGFSIFYYGFPFPNTAYAKLGNGIDRMDLIAQGRLYFLDSLVSDPITLIIIVLGFVISLRSTRLVQALTLGVFTYLLYILFIGGDFMSGRFFSAPFLLMVIGIAHTTLPTRLTLWILIPLTVLGLWNISTSILGENPRIPLIPPFPNGIADERRVHHKFYSVANYLEEKPAYLINPQRSITGDTQIEVMCHAAAGLQKGPALHIVDDCGLADPLLSRLPARRDREWRIGHFERDIPSGYLDSIRTHNNMIVDDATHQYYDAIKLVTQDPLFSWERMKMILLLNFNRIPKPNPYLYQYGSYFQPLAKNEVITFSKPGLTSRTLGWQANEDWGTWSDGNKSRFALPVPEGNPNTLRLNLRALIGGPIQCQQLYIDLNGQRTTQACLSQLENNTLLISLTPSDRVAGKPLIIDFYVPSAASPKSIGISTSDERVLGIGLQSAVFE
jgi:arabinofuranosyltransferase